MDVLVQCVCVFRHISKPDNNKVMVAMAVALIKAKNKWFFSSIDWLSFGYRSITTGKEKIEIKKKKEKLRSVVEKKAQLMQSIMPTAY